MFVLEAVTGSGDDSEAVAQIGSLEAVAGIGCGSEAVA